MNAFIRNSFFITFYDYLVVLYILQIHKLAILLICIEHCLSGVILFNIFEYIMYMVQNNVILRYII